MEKNQEKEHYTVLKYIVHPFPDQKKYIIHIYDAEELESLFFNNNLKHDISVLNNNIFLNIGHEHFVLENLDNKLIQSYLNKQNIIGFSFLDRYHAVLNGFYANSPK